MFGRDHVVHVAIAPGRLAERLHLEADRLAGLRGQGLDARGPNGRGREERGQVTAGLNDQAGVNG
jgi:hypothetical protein